MAMKGSAIVLKKGGSGTGGTSLGGFRTQGVTINSETVDVTTADSTGRWRELLAASGVKSMSITASGVLADSAAHATMVDDVIAQTTDTYGVVMAGLGTFDGSFQISNLEQAGEYNGEVTYSLTLESAGAVTFATA